MLFQQGDHLIVIDHARIISLFKFGILLCFLNNINLRAGKFYTLDFVILYLLQKFRIGKLLIVLLCKFIGYDAHNKKYKKRYHDKDHNNLAVFVITVIVLLVWFLIVHNFLRMAVQPSQPHTAYSQPAGLLPAGCHCLLYVLADLKAI